MRPISTDHVVWFVHPDDPAIDQQKSDLIAYRAQMDEGGVEAHLRFRDDETPTWWGLRPVSYAEFDAASFRANQAAGKDEERQERRLRYELLKRGLVGARDFGAPGERKPDLAELHHDVISALGLHVAAISRGLEPPGAGLVRQLIDLKRQARILADIVDHFDGDDGAPIDAGHPLISEARDLVVLRRDDETEARDLGNPPG